LGGIREATLAACVVVMATAWMTAAWMTADLAGAQETTPLTEAAASNDSDSGPFAYEEPEPVVAASPAGKVSLELPAGTIGARSLPTG
jgi:hypothetical protein